MSLPRVNAALRAHEPLRPTSAGVAGVPVQRYARRVQRFDVPVDGAHGHVEFLGELRGGHPSTSLQEQKDRHETAGCPDRDPAHFVRTDPGRSWIGCVWELPPIRHERDAWVRHMLVPDRPDLGAYLSDSMPDGMTGALG